ncbi:MAG: DoxX family protein [Acetobacteraceae bacterium]
MKRRTLTKRPKLGAVSLLARLCLVVLFPFSAADKIVHWNSGLKQARSTVPVGEAAVPMLVAAIAVETIAPVCIVTGRQDRLAAVVLAGFCVVTGGLYHQFWNYDDFWTPDTEGNAHFWDFLKNFGLVGGLLLVAKGPSARSSNRRSEHAAENPLLASLDRRRRR